MILDRWGEGGLVSYIRSAFRVMCVVAPLSPIQTSPTWSMLQVVRQTPRGGNYRLHDHHLLAHQSNPNSKTHLEARIVPVELGIVRKRSSNKNPKEGPVEVATRQIWAAAVASAGLVQNWLDLTEVRRLNGSIDYRCRLVSR